jgi:hypothetical protein
VGIFEAEHTPHRPSWDCEICCAPWPCWRAREVMLEEATGTYLTLRMGTELIAAVEDDLRVPPGELFDRFISWTRTPPA